MRFVRPFNLKCLKNLRRFLPLMESPDRWPAAMKLAKTRR